MTDDHYMTAGEISRAMAGGVIAFAITIDRGTIERLRAWADHMEHMAAVLIPDDGLAAHVMLDMAKIVRESATRVGTVAKRTPSKRVARK